MVTVLTLAEFVAVPDHPLDFLVGPPSFRPNALSAFAEGYNTTDGLVFGMSDRSVGGSRHISSTSAIVKAFKFTGAVAKMFDRQERIVINDPRGQQFQLVVRKGHPTDYGFDTSRCGPVIEQFCFLEDESLLNENGDPFTTGALFMHREVPSNPGYVEVWLVPKWRCRQGDTKIECPLYIELGSIRFRELPPTEIEPEGEVPKL